MRKSEKVEIKREIGLEYHGIFDKQMDSIENGKIGVRIEIVGAK